MAIDTPPPPSPTRLWRNMHVATCDEAMSVIQDAAIVTRGDTIVWCGPETELPELQDEQPEVQDLQGHWLTPGLVDCHTHLVFGGNRAHEYSLRLSGVSYEEIARRGGGILSTVRATREASEQQLFEESAPRLRALLAEGVTTVEIKSGYGLTLADERKMLRVARTLSRAHPVTVRTTFLAAHALPPEFAGRADEYIDVVSNEWLPTLHSEGLVDAVDIFCERIAFTAEQSERLFEAAAALGVPVKMHAEQLSNIGGTRLATRFHALSCDHLEYSSEEDAAAMAASGTVAVLLPVAFFCLDETRKPPIDAMRRHGVPLAIASDGNPGSAPSASLQLAVAMAMRLFRLSSEEALAAVTRNAARALGGRASFGMIAPGMRADFALWDVGSPDEIGYWLSFNRCSGVVYGGIRRNIC